ncbi:Ankyrin repeats (3 copies) [Candidatus Rubidus massiliensis]|nr:Ankyrin repeats (3 copies) [Candidatus Rubidus massiliensis]
MKGFKGVVKHLLKHEKVDPSDNANQAIIDAAHNGDTEIVSLLLENIKVKVGPRLDSAIKLAAKNGYIDVIRLFVADKSLNFNNYLYINDAFIIAVENGHIEIVEIFLLDDRFETCINVNQALLKASLKGYRDIKELLENHVRKCKDNIA